MKLLIHLLMKTNLPFSQNLAIVLFSLLFFMSVPIYSQNVAPVLSGIESSNLSYTENQIPKNITDSIVITDPEDIYIESATVKITDNYQNGEDILSFVNTLTITGSWSAGEVSNGCNWCRGLVPDCIQIGVAFPTTDVNHTIRYRRA